MAERSKADETIKKLAEQKAEQDAINTMQKYRNDMANRRLAMDEDNAQRLKEKGSTTDERGNKTTLWEKLERAADSAINEGQHAYQDWRSSMMSLLELCSLFLKAASQSRDELLSPATKVVKQLFREKVLYPLKDKCLDAIRGQPRGDLPELLHDVTMSDDHKLKIGDITFGDKSGANVPEFNSAFVTLVNLWLKDNNYELSADNTYVSADEHKIVLTKEVFEKLKEDPEKGLNAFLGKDNELEFRPRGP